MCPSPHGPQLLSPEGPKRATTGTPRAAAMCIGAESTPRKSVARSKTAASSAREVRPTKSIAGAAARDRTRLAASISPGSGPLVTATAIPRRVRWARTVAHPASGHALKSQRETAWRTTRGCPGARPAAASRPTIRTRASGWTTSTGRQPAAAIPQARTRSRFVSTMCWLPFQGMVRLSSARRQPPEPLGV